MTADIRIHGKCHPSCVYSRNLAACSVGAHGIYLSRRVFQQKHKWSAAAITALYDHNAGQDAYEALSADGLQKGRCIALGGALCVNQKHALDNRSTPSVMIKGGILSQWIPTPLINPTITPMTITAKSAAGRFSFRPIMICARNHVGKGDGIRGWINPFLLSVWSGSGRLRRFP